MRLMKAKQAPLHLLTFPRSNAQKSRWLDLTVLSPRRQNNCRFHDGKPPTVQQLAGGTFEFLPCQVLPFLGIPGGEAALLHEFGTGANAVHGRVRRVVYLSTSHACFDSSKTYPAAEIQSTYRAVFPSPFVHCPRKETGPLGRTKARVRLRTKALETLIPTRYTDI